MPEVGLACGQDRIKEWGKRYLAPMLAWFGIEFPDRVVKVRLPSDCANLFQCSHDETDIFMRGKAQISY